MNYLKTRILILLLSAFATVVVAEPIWYVHDYLLINLRDGADDKAKIIRTLPSGTALEFLDEDDRFVHVRAKDGVTGWVLKQYLSAKPVARILLEQTQEKLVKLEGDFQVVTESNQRLNSDNKTLLNKNKQLEIETKTLRKENTHFRDVAARPIEIEKKNKALSIEVESLRLEKEQLSKSNNALKESSTQKWFMFGSGVLIMGIILGLLLPHLRYRKDSHWS